MNIDQHGISRRTFIRASAVLGATALVATSGVRMARAAPAELRYFYRAPWPSSEIYANWLIDEWNNKNGDRVHVTGASVDGETYKTKQTIELARAIPGPLLFLGRRARQGNRQQRILRRSDALLRKIRLGQVAQSGGRGAVATSTARSISCRRRCAPRWSGTARTCTSKLGLKVPTTWDELMANAQKAKGRRHRAVHAGQPEEMAIAVHVVGDPGQQARPRRL